MSNCKIHGKDCYNSGGLYAECNELVNKQELTRLRAVSELFADMIPYIQGSGNYEDASGAYAAAADILRRYNALTEAKAEPKMHTNAFGQPLIGRPSHDQD